MPRRQLPLLFAACAILGAATGAHAQVLDDKANMKILSARSLMLRVNQDYFNDQLRKSGAPTTPEDTLDMYRARVGCGSVDIGNQFVDKGIGNEISVIIVGDVINVGNRCAR